MGPRGSPHVGPVRECRECSDGPVVVTQRWLVVWGGPDLVHSGGCVAGVYESFDTLCIYLESDQSTGSDPDRNFWVKYRMAVVNQKHADRTVWKGSSILTKTWNNSVLQFMKVSDMVEADAGFVARDTVVFVCEILDCCPWFEFSDLEVRAPRRC